MKKIIYLFFIFILIISCFNIVFAYSDIQNVTLAGNILFWDEYPDADHYLVSFIGSSVYRISTKSTTVDLYDAAQKLAEQVPIESRKL